MYVHVLTCHNFLILKLKFSTELSDIIFICTFPHGILYILSGHTYWKKMNITVTHAWIVVFIPYLPLSTQKAKLYFLQICFALKWIFRYLKPLDSINLEYKVIKFIEKKYLPQKRRPLLVWNKFGKGRLKLQVFLY